MARNEFMLAADGADSNQEGAKSRRSSTTPSGRDGCGRPCWASTTYGLVFTASMMMGVSAVRTDVKSMIMTSFAVACSVAIREFVSVYSQVAQMKRELADGGSLQVVFVGGGGDQAEKAADLPSPLQAAVASALALSVGAMVPLLAAGFIRSDRVRLGVVCAAVTLALLAHGLTGAKLGGVPVGRRTTRVLVGGWMAMAATYGLMKMVHRIAAF